MHRYYSDYPEDEKNNVGLDFDHPAFSHDLQCSKEPLDVGLHRIKIASHRKYISERYDSEYTDRKFNWKQHWYHLPLVILRQAFSTNELCRLAYESVISCPIHDELHYDPNFRVIGKIHSSLWHWSHGRPNYNHVPYWYNALTRFDFGIADTQVRLDYATYHNEFGHSKYTRTYVDGAFAYLVYYKGEHVLTIGFSVSCYGLLISQIQMKHKKGNRWLFKLPKHYVEYVVQKMAEAYHDTPIWLVDGLSLADRIRNSYRKEDRHHFTEEKSRHVASVYDRDLNRFRRYKNQKVVLKSMAFNRLYDITRKLSLKWADDSFGYRPYDKAA